MEGVGLNVSKLLKPNVVVSITNNQTNTIESYESMREAAKAIN